MPRAPQARQQSSSTTREQEQEQAAAPTGDVDETMDQTEQVEGEVDGYASSTPTSSLTWITWFCSLPGHEYFCEVSEEFIEDDFNLTGLNSMVPFWKEALEMVLDVEPEDTLKIPDVSIVEASAELLYGLVHQRYILTRAGLQAMVEKYDAGQFGTCPRVYCVSCHVVPCGRSDLPGLDTVKLYCPNCHDIYTPPSSRFQGVDGAFFGTTFAHLFFQTYRELAPAPYSSFGAPNAAASPSRTAVNSNAPWDGQKVPASKIYTPKIYGFRVSERARSGPRMQWLRLRPETAAELDTVDWRGRWITGEESEDDRGLEPDTHGPAEEFDPDNGDDDQEEDEEEEEEEDAPAPAPPTTKERASVQRKPARDPLTTSRGVDVSVIAPPSARNASQGSNLAKSGAVRVARSSHAAGPS